MRPRGGEGSGRSAARIRRRASAGRRCGCVGFRDDGSRRGNACWEREPAMMSAHPAFQESTERAVPIRDLGLTIVGTSLEPVIAAFEKELDEASIKVHPRFYLSTEWGVADQSIAIAIPFYLARPEL